MSGDPWDDDEVVQPAPAPPQLPPQSGDDDAGAYANQPSNLQAGGANFAAPFPGAVQDPRDVNVWRKPDTGEIGYIGQTGGASIHPDGSAEVNIVGSSNPQYIASYLAKRPEMATPMAPQGSPPTLPSAAGADPWSSDPIVSAPAPSGPPAGAPLKSDELLGFGRELVRPIENAGYWLESGLDKIGLPISAADHALGWPDAKEMIAHSDAKVADAAAHGVKPGFFGSAAGAIMGSLPALALPGGPLVQGAATGALGTNNPSSPQSVALSGILGSILGKGADAVGSGLINTIAPKISAGAQTLMNAGMGHALTPGMIAGKHSVFGLAESAAQAVPIAGEMIRDQGNKALIAANRAVADRVAAGFGGQATGDTAEDLARSVMAAKNNAYDIHTPNGTQLDPVYAATVNGIRGKVAGIPQQTGLPQSFDRLLRTEIASRVDPATGTLSDQGVTSAKNAISKEIADWSGDASGWSRQYVGHLKELRGALTQNLGRADPAAQAQLSAADANYPAYKALLDALRRGTQNSTNEPGWFTPQQLQSAITANTPTGKLVTGGAPMQDLATAMKGVLPRKFKDVVSPWHAIPEAMVASGVAGSDILGGHGAALTAGMLGAIPLYSEAGQAVLRRSMLATAAGRAALESKVGPLNGYVRSAAAPAGGFFGGMAAKALNSYTVPAR